MQPSQMTDIEGILTGLVSGIVSIECTTPGCLHIPRNDCIDAAIKTAADQIRQQQRERVKKLEKALIHAKVALENEKMTFFERETLGIIEAVLKEMEAR